ncbi:MAG: dienelactone hydrolase family protein, partial [Pseudomonadota bacterium]
EWQAAGHDVTLPDLFEGETSETYDGGFEILERVALDTVEARAARIAEALPDEVVIAGVSMGAGIASHVWKRKPNAKGILFLAGMGPWPDKVNSAPVHVHAARPEPFDDEEWFTSWEKSNPGVPLSLFRYDKVGHYFLDKSLPDFDADANKLCRERCLEFLRQLSDVR